MISAQVTDASIDLAALKPALEEAALKAGATIMSFYTGDCAVQIKDDSSPVSEADHAAEAIILDALTKATPNVAVVAEEEVAAGRIPSALGDAFFLVDPLDGTREFLQRNGDFTVNIALIVDHAPLMGVVYAPARNVLFVGGPGGAEKIKTNASHEPLSRKAIKVRLSSEPPVVVCSRSHETKETTAYLSDHALLNCVRIGSSLKFCIIADGEADLYPRFGPTMEWDTAAGDAVLRAAGGRTIDCNGQVLRYGLSRTAPKPFANPDFIAYGAGDIKCLPKTRLPADLSI